MEYLALIAEIETLKEEELAAAQAEIVALRAPKQPKPTKVPCPGMTGKGMQCKKYCMPNETTCKVHGREIVHKAPKVPTKPKPTKKVCTGLNMRGNTCKGEVFGRPELL